MLKKLENLLKNKKIKYKLVKHKKVYTAFDRAATLRIDLKTVGKVLFIKVDSDYIFVVLGANKKLDKNKLKKIINKKRKTNKEKTVKKISICSEAVIKRKITGKNSALIAMGSVYGLKTYVDQSLMRQKKINLSSGDFIESIEMTPVQFKKIEEEMVAGALGKGKTKKLKN